MKKISIKTILISILTIGFIISGLMSSPAIGSVPDLSIDKVFAADMNSSAITSADHRGGDDSIFSWYTILSFSFVIIAIVAFRRDTE